MHVPDLALAVGCRRAAAKSGRRQRPVRSQRRHREQCSGKPLPAEQWREYCLASVTTHDLPPTAGYLAADHVTVVYEPQRSLDLDNELARRGVQRRFTVLVPGFAGLPPFIRGSRRLATAPALLQMHLMQGLASAKVPLPCPTLPMYMIWHRRHQDDAAHRWLREQLVALAPGATAETPQAER